MEMTPMEMTPIESRRAEVAQYEANITMYQTIFAGLPSWDTAPERLLSYRSTTDKHGVIATITDLDDVTLLSQLWYSDECFKAIRTETVEKTKSQTILNALES